MMRGFSLKRTILLAVGAGFLFCLAFVVGFLTPHPRHAGLSLALDIHGILKSITPKLLAATLVVLLGEAVMAWQGRQTRFRWTLLAGAMTISSFALLRGIDTSFLSV